MDYVAISITKTARERLRATTLAFISPVGRRVTMSEVLVAACDLAQRHPDETVQELTDPTAGRGNEEPEP